MEVNPARFVSIPNIGRVPAGKVVCIGRNYAKHAAELNNPVPETPIVFLKPGTALVGEGASIQLPANVGEIHHEVELVAVMGHRVKNASLETAQDAVVAYAVGLDMTARALQTQAKEARGPWAVAKGFDTFAPIGKAVPASEVNLSHGRISLHVNGALVQQGHLRDMIFSVPELVAYCSTVFTLEPGDLIYTGTPAGVGPVHAGDSLAARISGLPDLLMHVTD